MKFAVVKIGKSQYKVQEGDQLLIDHLASENLKEGDKKDIEEVLMVVVDEKAIIGKPYLRDKVVTLKVLGEQKGKKLRVATYKAKSRERRVVGFRGIYTKVVVEKISDKISSKSIKKPVVRR